MKTVLVLVTLFFGLFINVSYAQVGPAIEFEYDNIGNRVKRFYNPTATLNKYGDTLTHNSPPDTIKKNSQQPADVLIKAYPNPVADELIVENLSWKDNDKAVVKIFDIAGKAVVGKAFSSSKEQFSLSSFVPGVYQVHYYINNRLITTWKIIKK